MVRLAEPQTPPQMVRVATIGMAEGGIYVVAVSYPNQPAATACFGSFSAAAMAMNFWLLAGLRLSGAGWMEEDDL